MCTAQENKFSRNAIKLNAGFVVNEGRDEIGLGTAYALGYQRSFGKKEKWRLIPSITFGSVNSNFISDTRDYYYTFASVGLKLNYDVVKYKAFSFFLETGGFVNYTSGLVGTGGENYINTSNYFNENYLGAIAGLGFRINPVKSRIAYEIKPLTLHFNTKNYFSAYVMLGLDIKL